MHELSIARSIHEIALEEARRSGAERVLAVNCRAGVLRQIVPSLLQSAFDSVNDGTPLAGSSIRIAAEPIRVSCKTCGKTSPAFELLDACPACGSTCIHFFGGMDLQVTSITVEEKGVRP